jgi:hypothetical protein
MTSFSTWTASKYNFNLVAASSLSTLINSHTHESPAHAYCRSQNILNSGPGPPPRLEHPKAFIDGISRAVPMIKFHVCTQQIAYLMYAVPFHLLPLLQAVQHWALQHALMQK